MPYNLPGETPEQTKKMERCVTDRIADPKFKPLPGRTKKEAAIAICKSSIMGTTKRGRTHKATVSVLRK